MSTLNQLYKTLADWAKLADPTGTPLTVAEILEKSTPMFEDMPFIEGNLPTGHKGALRTELPSTTWVKYYGGALPSKGKRQTLTWGIGRARQIAHADADLVSLQNNKELFLKDLEIEHVMSLGQSAEEQIIYGSGANPERLIGLAATYDHLSTSDTDLGYNVIDAGGTGSDNTSIWLVYWGNNNITGIYPQGSAAGIRKTVEAPRLTATPDGSGAEYEAIKMHFKLDIGLAIPDWRSVVRIANIDSSELADAGESGFDGANLPNLLIKAINKFLPSVTGMGRGYIYCNRTVKTALDLLSTNKSTMGFHTIKDAEGMEMNSFRQMPIRLAEKILNNEAQVTA